MFPKRHGDPYKTLRSQLTGGLSLIFCRLAISGETKIRSHEIDNPETVKKVLGLDANSLYLYAIAQNNPTGYKEEEDFRPDPCSKFGFQSYQWLSYVAYKENTFLQTRFNMGKEESASIVCQWTVILSNKTPYINFLVVSFILAIGAIPIETLTEV